MQTINIRNLGTDYNIIDEKGNLVKSIKIVKHEEILQSALGEYNEFYYADYSEYLNNGIEQLHNFADSPYDVLWHRCTEDEFDLMSIVDKCVSEGYKFVILETVSFSDLLEL